MNNMPPLVLNKRYDSPCSTDMLTQDRAVNVMDPHSFQPSLAEIIHALPNINRYNGHTLRPYSVAEHSINCMLVGALHHGLAEDHHRLYFLLHDCAEAYLQDIIRPIKRYAPDALIVAEEIITDNVFENLPLTYGQRGELEGHTFQKIMREIDTRMAVTEVQQLIPKHPNPIPGWTPYNITLPEEPQWFMKEDFELHINTLIDRIANENR